MSGPPHKHEFGPREEDLARCVHCGFCLQACPTYVVLGLETESPRGRIALARAVSEKRIEPTPQVIAHFDLCLQCRACETACPSGVPYGRIIEDTRALVQERPDRPASWKLRSFVLRQAFAAPWRLRLGFSLLRFYQRTPIAPLARRLLPKRLRDMEAILPRLPNRFFDPPVHAAEPAGTPKATIGILSGCIMGMTHPQTHEATVRVLARNGYRVLVPRDQGCCGALHVHNGDPKAARVLARKNIDAFLASGVDYVVVNSAGCGSAMKEYGDLFAGERDEAKARRFAAIVKDVTELLDEDGFEAPKGRVEARVTYQDSCHLVHAQRISKAPRSLLRAIPGLDFVEMETPDRCCGSAGIYNVTQTEMSRRILDDKMDDVMRTNPDIVSTANPGCMLQLQLGLNLRHDDAEVLHVVELLDRAYQNEPR
ncbi:MAG TPA: heterodisulfide reductase-related iron-sulfur binding cluster [Dehalococcoidia bacterium]|nr:heterodisulfide reductase-related iron-sulfur binding cluster [Dehalococcoidia bacterium]